MSLGIFDLESTFDDDKMEVCRRLYVVNIQSPKLWTIRACSPCARSVTLYTMAANENPATTLRTVVLVILVVRDDSFQYWQIVKMVVQLKNQTTSRQMVCVLVFF